MDLLTNLRTLSSARAALWHEGSDPWSGADWSNAMCGEAGEAANVVKKLRRIETSALTSVDTRDVVDLRQKLGHELADVIIYADLLALHYDIDLRLAIVEKFNIVSEKRGFTQRLVP